MCDCVRPNGETKRKTCATTDTLNLQSVPIYLFLFISYVHVPSCPLNSNKKLYYKKFRKISFCKEFVIQQKARASTRRPLDRFAVSVSREKGMYRFCFRRRRYLFARARNAGTSRHVTFFCTITTLRYDMIT